MQNGVPVATPFAVLPQVYTESECGLIGIAFHPAFIDNGFVYLFVTVSDSEQQIVRYTANGSIGENATVIVSGLPTRGLNHDGGALSFGPDGNLYWAIGDNGNGTGVDDDLSSLAAKVGRATPEGLPLNDNPFFDGVGPNNDFIWARGFRNPFTMTWDPKAERLWLNVVGSAFEQAFVVSKGAHGGWNDYESNQPAGYLPPVISYATGSTTPRTIAADGAVRSSGVVTFTTTTPHRFRPGAQITITNVVDPSFNGYSYVKSVPNETQFTFSQPGPDVVSGGGKAASALIGSAIVGGTFWDSTALPANRRGFYFGDYTGGRLIRATFDVNRNVAAVEEWNNAHKGYVDADIGPDGNLYYAGITGPIFRVTYAATSQGIVVSRLHVRVPEGSSAALGVRLAQAPTSAVTVSAARSAGDADLNVSVGSSLVFDANNWSTPQVVRVTANADTDSVDDTASIALTSAGLATETVTARATDDDVLGILLSTNAVTLDEGGQGKISVTLTGPPASTLTLSVDTSGEASLLTSPTSLSFNAGNWNKPQAVTLSADQDDNVSDDSASLDVSATGLTTRSVAVTVLDDDDRAPTITSTAPLSGVVGADYSYDAAADGNPASAFSLDSAPDGMSIEPATGMIVWRPTAPGTFAVVLRASNGIDPDATQPFDVVVALDQPPQCKLTAPESGEVLSGAMAEFFGDVTDDVGAVGAKFWVDGALIYDDAGPGGHYHCGGAHNSFDTTQLTFGSHLLSMTGQDTAGQECRAEVSIVIDNGETPGATGGAGGDASGGQPALPTDGGRDAGMAGAPDATTEGGSPHGEGGASSPGGAGALAQGGAVDPISNASGGRSVNDGGCGCRVTGAGSQRSASPWVVLLALVLSARRRRQRTSISLV